VAGVEVVLGKQLVLHLVGDGVVIAGVERVEDRDAVLGDPDRLPGRQAVRRPRQPRIMPL